MVYGRPSKAFNCMYAIEGKSNGLAQKGEADLCSPSMCLKAISGPWSWDELLNATWLRLRLGPSSDREKCPFRTRSYKHSRNGCYFLKLVSFIKTRSFRMTKTHTCTLTRIGSFTVPKGKSFNSWLPLDFSVGGMQAVLFRQRGRDGLCVC